jgi:hypothetical protein
LKILQRPKAMKLQRRAAPRFFHSDALTVRMSGSILETRGRHAMTSSELGYRREPMLYIVLTATVATLYSHAAVEACQEECKNRAHRLREIGIALSYWGLSGAKSIEFWLYSATIQHSVA